MKITYSAAKKNTRLTDFGETKTLVLNNAVKNVPELVKSKSKDKESNSALSHFF